MLLCIQFMKERIDHDLVRRLPHEVALEELKYFQMAGERAKLSTCLQAHCGAVIVKDGEIIGEGYNSPPLDSEANRTCLNEYEQGGQRKPQFDTTCCVHAEWRAILDGCKKNPDKMEDSILFFVRIDDDGNFRGSGVPRCTTCSRLAMEAGIGTFALWSPDEVILFDTAEYDRLSYAFFATRQE